MILSGITNETNYFISEIGCDLHKVATNLIWTFIEPKEILLMNLMLSMNKESFASFLNVQFNYF